MIRHSMPAVVRIVVVLLALACGSARADVIEFKDGDVVFQTSRSAQSVAIQRATGSKYSHVGLVFIRDGVPVVFEAAATVRYTPMAEWTRQGTGGRFVVKRLKGPSNQLTPPKVQRLREAARALEGKPYDLTFEWSDSRIYCSELVWKIYQRALGVEVGALRKMRTFKLDDPLVKRKLAERFGRALPLDEPMISPGEMFDSAELETIATR
jgi:hypothetical protein